MKGKIGENQRLKWRTFRLDFLQTVPEEVCCRAIELFKLMPDGSREQIKFNGYTIAAGKNNKREHGSYFGLDTYLEIHEKEIGDSGWNNWFFALECRTRNEEKNIIKEICEKLTKELVRL